MSYELILLVVIAALAVFMFWRGGQQRKKRALEMETRMVPGAKVMIGAGIFGTIQSLDKETQKAVLEIAPGVQITVLQQAIVRFEDPVPTDTDAIASDAPEVEAGPNSDSDTSDDAKGPRAGGLFGRQKRDADQ